MKWWREIAVWCGMSWCDFKCFCGMDKVMRSIQSSLLFLYYVVFSVMSVQYCLCVSRIASVQFLKRSVVESVAYIVSGVQC